MNLTELIAILSEAPARYEVAEHAVLERVGHIVEQTAKGLLGHEQPEWPPLAASTISDKLMTGAPVPSPLLRTGQHIRDTIEHHVDGHMVSIGSNDLVAKYQEDGTERIPPRPFLKTAAIRVEHEITEIIAHTIGRSILP